MAEPADSGDESPSGILRLRWVRTAIKAAVALGLLGGIGLSGAEALLPAVLAIVLAVWTRNVILSLFSAVALAGIIHVGGSGVGPISAVVGGVAHSLDKTVVGAIADADHAKTVLFTLLMGGMVGVIGKSGGTKSVVEALARRAKSKRSVQMLSWLSGMVVFFDDYANCMIVGSAMGPLCDRYKVSRAKLAYIVDSTAAPVASLALVSTWIGFEVGVIEEGLKIAKETVPPGEAYSFFVQGWPYRFYPILALIFVGFVAWSGRDFGPMLRERGMSRAAVENTSEDPIGQAPWWVAALPILTLVFVTLLVMYLTGIKKWTPDKPYFEILSNADGYGAIVAGSFCAVALAVALSLVTRSLKLQQATDAAVDGMKLMFEALIVLILAWALSSAMKELHAPQYLVGLLGDKLSPAMLPTVTFLVGAVIAFAVGSSYTTMGIMMPMVVPLAFKLAPGGDVMIPLAASGSVLAGACFGDHCSPISDTTVLSSIGSGSELLAHVRTQLPYALLIGGISVVFGTLPAGYGLNPWLCLVVGAAVSAVALYYLGKPAPDDEVGAEPQNAAPAASE